MRREHEREMLLARGGNLWCSARSGLPHRRIVALRAIAPKDKY